MSSLLLLAVVACLLAVPGLPASAIVFGSADAAPPSVLTVAAAAFGLGFTVTGGFAFALSAAHLFRLAVFLPLWLAVSAGLWAWAVRRAPARDQLRSLAADAGRNKLALAAGALVLLVLLVIHLRYLYVLGGPRYVYYLNGVEIANSHGVPAATLEYGQSWPPATDKIYLDAFTGLLVLIMPNAAIGPGVLLLVSTLGAFLGLWATAWELGLRRLGVLLPVLYLGNALILNTAVSIAYTDYRAEDFGRAVAFCALAVGIAAIREPGWRPAVAAGAILAAASGSHLIPVVVVALALCLAGLAALAFGTGDGRMPAVLRLLAAGGVSVVLAIVIRAFAGGSFGLEGAQNSASYARTHTAFDPTAYLYGGSSVAKNAALWNTQPWHVVENMASGSAHPPAWELWLLLGLPVVAAAVLLLAAEFRPLAVTGFGLMAGTIAVGLAFALHYHTYIEQTFGIRRLTSYVIIGFLLLAIGLAELGLALLGRSAPRACAVVALAAVVALSAWLLPSTAVSRQQNFLAQQRTRLVDWVRTATPCNARFLTNQRTEGTFTALTGRFTLTEGMGAFLRTQQLPYVVGLMLKTQKFFRSPAGDEKFLQEHDISYVVAARGYQELGYAAPIGPPNFRQLAAAPFLQLVFSTRSILVYQVVGARSVPVSPLLKGPYLHCAVSPVRF